MKILNWLLYGSISEIWPYIVVFKLQNIELEPLGTKLYSRPISQAVSSKSHTGRGCSAKYYTLSKSRGVKVLTQNFFSYDEAIESSYYKDALKEASTLRKARTKYPNIPKCYGVRILKEGFYRIGIVMQHLGDQVGTSFDLEETFGLDRYSLIKTIQDKLEKFGIIHRDIHLNNLIWYKNEWWVIDFDPEYVTINP